MRTLATSAIGSIEALEQQVEALKNEASSEVEVHNSQEEIERLNRLLLIVQVERNTLSQALRIISSAGTIDPTKETEEAEASHD